MCAFPSPHSPLPIKHLAFSRVGVGKWRPPAWIFKFNGKVPDPHRLGARSCCFPLAIILGATAFFCCPSCFRGNLGEAKGNGGILSFRVSDHSVPFPHPPITGSRERKAGWHLFLIGCFKSLFSPGQSGERRSAPQGQEEVGGSWVFPSSAPRMFRWVRLWYKSLSETTETTSSLLFHHSRLGALWELTVTSSFI